MTTKSTNKWFDVDRTGLEKLLKRKGVEFAVFELIQNAWDEAGVTRVEVTLKPADERGYAWLCVQDDAPEGFKDLRHAYTLFAESAKKTNPKQRGQFNIGEKLVLALCREAVITTTKGTVLFNKNGTRTQSDANRSAGSVFNAKIRMTTDEVAEVSKAVHKLLPPPSIWTTFNGVEIEPRDAAQVVKATLPTTIADSEGFMVRTTRKTTVNCHKPNNGETPMIYEMGIPVVEHDCAFHCDVQQKVELTIDRENVTPSFLKALRTAVFNATHEELTVDEVNHEWAQTAIESGNATDEAVTDYMTKRFGEKRASYDPSDPEANRAAVAQGFTIVHGSMLSKDAWANVRTAEAITPAGQLFPTHSDAFVAFQPADLTDNMREVAAYSLRLAELLLGCSIVVEFGEQASREAACWGHRRLQFNVRNLGKHWFNMKTNRRAIDDLIIHEFGHHYSGNHLSEDYYHALSALAAHAMELGRAGKLPDHG